MPYFGYARQDKASNQAAMPAQLIANFLKLGVTHLITIDLHSDKIERFFNIPVSNLKPIELYLPFLQNYKNCIIVAPDKGSINKVETIGNLLNINLAYITKERDVNNSCNMVEITGNVESRNCILIDDIIDSGETIYKAVNFLKQHGALSVNAFITHAVLSKNYDIALLDRIFVTDTIETDDLSSKFHIIPILPISKRVKKYNMSLCTLEINLSAIKANYRLLKNICENALVGAAVKANSYGFGAIEISKTLLEENCRYFFVASSNEGISLRKAIGNEVNILILNGVFEHDALELIEYNLIPVLNNLNQIKIWQKFSSLKNQLLPCYLHFNTGINRLGLNHNEIEQLINNHDLLKGLNVEYIISHLSASEDSDNPYNLEQLNKFKAYLEYFPTAKASLANSGGIFLGKDYHFNLVRPGAALYGLNPLGSNKPNPMQNPVTLKAPIIHLQNLTYGSRIGYNMTFTTKRDSLIATLPFGYADGFSRNFSNQGTVFINGRNAPIIGRISMDLVNIDVTDLPPSDIFLGQEVEIIGNNCTPDKIADIIGTIGYEILTSLGNRYKRIYT